MFVKIGRIVRESSGPKEVGDYKVYENALAWDTGFGDKKKPCFMDFKIWGKRAEPFHKLVCKGARVELEGEIEQDTWEDKEGNKRSKHVLKVSNFTCIDYREKDDDSSVDSDSDFDDPGKVPF